MRWIWLVVLLCGCGPDLRRRDGTRATLAEDAAEASHAFVGVIEAQEFLRWTRPFGGEHWRYLWRRVRVEAALKGDVRDGVVDVWEVFWAGGASGDWNGTEVGGRYLFPVVVEKGRYRMVRDYWRSIWPVASGPHSRAPLDERAPLFERLALLNYWMDGVRGQTVPWMWRADPERRLGWWREAKLARGLLRHPNLGVRVAGCRVLLGMGGWGQDECWEQLSETERAHLRDGGATCCFPEDIAVARRRQEGRDVATQWANHLDRDERRLLTTVSNRRQRAAFCELYLKTYPGDTDHGCPAERTPPATMVTEAGDIPLAGAWPGKD